MQPIASPRRRQVQAQALEQRAILDRQAGHDRQGHLLVQALADPAIKGTAVLGRTAGHPHHHSGVQAGEAVGRQAVVDRQVIHPIAEVLQQAAEHPVPGVVVEFAFAGVVEHGDATRLYFHATQAQGIELRRGDHRDKTFLAQLADQLARFFATVGRQVVDGHQRDIACTQRLEFAFQPVAVGFGHRPIALGRGIPAGMDRFDGDGRGHAIQFTQHFETPVEEQLQARLTAVQLPQKGCQRLALRFAAGFRKQLETVEGIEEQAGIALLLQGLGALEQVLAPGWRGDVHDLAVPGLVAGAASALAQGFLVQGRTVAVELAHRQVGKRLAAEFTQGGDITAAHMAGFDHGPFELRQFLERWPLGVPEPDAGRCRRCGLYDRMGRTQCQRGEQPPYGFTDTADTRPAKLDFHNLLFSRSIRTTSDYRHPANGAPARR